MRVKLTNAKTIKNRELSSETATALRTLAQPIDVTEVDKTFEEFLSETDKLLFAKLNQHQHMFLRYYQHGNTKN